MEKKKGRIETRKLVLLALLTAIVVVLQLFGSAVKFGPFSVSFVLLPIVVGAALLGTYSGGWLGLVFGLVVMFTPDVAPFLAVNPLGTVVLVVVRGIIAGLAAGAAYKLLAKRSRTGAVIVAAAVAPIVNTGLFVVGLYVFFWPLVTSWAAAAGFSSGTLAFVIFGMIGVNFLFELALNLVLSPVIVRLVQYGQDNRGVVN